MGEAAKTDEKTKYRVLRVVDGETPMDTTLAELDIPEGGVVCVLLPSQYEGNAIKAAHTDHGDGTYGRFPARGFELKSARMEAVVKIA